MQHPNDIPSSSGDNTHKTTEIISSADMASASQPEVSRYEQLEKYVLTPEQLDKNKYVRPPLNVYHDFILGGKGKKNIVSSHHKCMRCTVYFQLDKYKKVVCRKHAGKFILKREKWSCCSMTSKKSPGCVKYDDHVHSDNIDYGVFFEDHGHWACPVGFVRTQERRYALNTVTTHKRGDAVNTVTTQGRGNALNTATTQEQCDAHNIVALKCEMVYTSGGMEVAKVSLVDPEGSVLVDTYVKPTNTIRDLNTSFSGITNERILLKAPETLSSVQKLLMKHIHSNTIIVGHSLECNLKALRMIHLKVVDAAVVYLNKEGNKVGLRKLSQDNLGVAIQTEQNKTSRQRSVKSASAAMMLMLQKVGIKKPARLHALLTR